jgi:hypothetical protein
MQAGNNKTFISRRKSSEIVINAEEDEKNTTKTENNSEIVPNFKKQEISSIIYSEGQTKRTCSTEQCLFSELNNCHHILLVHNECTMKTGDEQILKNTN